MIPIAGQISQYGAMAAANLMSGAVLPVVAAGTSPPTWKPGMLWYNTTTSAWNQWNGSAWVSSPAPGTNYLALLIADPVAGGAVNISDAGFIELSIGGYSRQTCAFGAASAGYPGVCANTAVITFGPITTTMSEPVQWIALVTSASGTSGYFMYSWALSTPVQVDASQQIQIGIGQLVIQDQ